MEEVGIEILEENIQKNNFIRKISSQTEEQEQIIRKKVQLNMRIELLLLRIFVSEEI